MNASSSRKQEILQAAQQEFIKEGFSGARLQHIADPIDVTKAMIHYYFKTKQHLFKEVFRQVAKDLLAGLMKELEKEEPIFKKIEHFIDRLINRLEQQREQLGFVINELEQHPEITSPIFKDVCDYELSVFNQQLKEAAKNYSIISAAPEQVIANILSLCMFPYSANNFVRIYLDFEEEEYQPWLEKRREITKDVIINWLAG